MSDKQQPISLDDFGRDALRRRTALGITFVAPPRNAGDRRTPSKKALLKAITAAGGKW